MFSEQQEERIRQIFRDEQARLMTPVGAGEPAVDKPKPVTPESQFDDIVNASATFYWSQIVESCESLGLTDLLIASDKRIGFDAYRCLNHKFKSLNASDTTRLGLEAPRSYSLIGLAAKETAADIDCAKAGKLAEEAQAAKASPETQNGMTRKEVFAEENERRAMYQDNSLPPLDKNRWAFRR